MDIQDFPLVSNFMRKVPPVLPSFTLKEVAKHMEHYKTPIVGVTEKDTGKIIGAIDLTTLIKPFIPEFIDFLDDFNFVSNFGALEHKIFSGEMHRLFVAMDIMLKEYPWISESDSVAKALFSIYKSRITGLIVKSNEIYKGIITRFDLLRFLYDTDD